MAADGGKSRQRIEWKYSKARDILELWGETDEGGTKRIEVPGSMIRALTSDVAFEDLPHHRREYFLSELYLRPRAYGGKIIKD